MNESVNSSHHKKQIKKNAGSLRASCYIRKRPQVCYSLKKWRSGALLEGELTACNVSVISGRVRMWTIQNQFIYCLLCSYCCLLTSKEEFGKYLIKVFWFLDFTLFFNGKQPNYNFLYMTTEVNPVQELMF